MYLKIGENQYSCTKRIKSAAGTLKFLGVSPAPGDVSGTIQMYRNDGFLMSEDDTSQYIRQKYAGTMLAFFAYPEPEPAPVTPSIPAPSNEKLQAVARLAMMQAQSLPYAQALEVPELYPEWEPDTAYAVQYIVSRPNGHLYRCQQGHTSQEGWEPENTPALWVVLANGEAGTQDDPITAARGMEYQYGLYYRDPEDGKTYLCSRIGEAEGGKIVLQYLPHELVGQYFSESE